MVIHALSNYGYALKVWEHVIESAKLAYTNRADGFSGFKNLSNATNRLSYR